MHAKVGKRMATAGIVFLLIFFSIPGHADDLSVTGSFSNRYRFRSAGDSQDQRLDSLLTVNVGNALDDQFTGFFQGGGIFDLHRRGALFGSPYDSFSNRSAGRLYSAYFNATDLGPIKNLRTGRQSRYDFEPLTFDGVSLEFIRKEGWTLSAFGGVPVHLFENQFGISRSDWLAGGALQWNPHEKFQAKADFIHLRDKVANFRTGVGNREDNLIGLTAWLDLDEHLALSTRFTTFTDQLRDVNFTTTIRSPEHDFSMRLGFYRLLKGYDIRVTDFDAYRIAGTYLPYSEFSVNVTKGIGKHFTIDAGGNARLLNETLVANAFNHGYERVFASLSSSDLPFKGLSLSLTEDYYRGEDNVLKNDNFGTSFSIAQSLFDKRLKLSGGTAYSLYRYNLYSGNESQRVHTYYARVTGKILKQLEARAGYEYEQNSASGFHTADLRLTWSF